MKTLTKAEVESAVMAAKAAPVTMRPVLGGCARIYVGVYGVDKKTVNAFAAACKKLGLTFLRKAYPSYRNVVYIGYDNATGREYCKGESFAEALTTAGIPAMVDAESD